ncbi:class I SAM-dependent DNA methyltransferase [Leisingera aquaemixtae]|uniref:site-specific DNA-methyltransferase (adenine-specific) n=1 Tax=Leisingera aquaemixtae TaxID=1396826 RepID=A0A0P1H9B7_9RHOB|nr:DNA methyltransferase [Leisingera aquaemixtae]CUH99798.1 Type I restriction-modification system methyltransferase subunit [Leisingera aquaemixtae]
MNPTEISDALEAISTAPFDPAEFGYDFAAATGNAKATVSRLRPGKRTLNKSKISGAVLMNRRFYYIPAELGQADAAMELLLSDKKTIQHKPEILIATDGQDVVARHPASGDTLRCSFVDLHHHFGFFLPAAGMTRFKAAEENEVDIKATGKLAKLYDALIKKNPDWATEDRRHDLNQFMTRMIFCLFAEDVGIFPKDQFSRLIVNHSGEKGVEAHLVIRDAFAAMNLPKDGRAHLPAWTQELEYVNGGLFSGQPDCPVFDPIAWGYLLDAAGEDWRKINPDIFGSMIQSIADAKRRSELGMHYTSVPNILKVLGPLFLDDLDAAIEKAWDRPNSLEKLLTRLGRIRVFDPACGSGNFLVVAYRQLREREMKVMKRLVDLTGQSLMKLSSTLSLSSFHGIEITDFGAETAKLALFIAEYQANAEMSEMFGAATETLPLRDGGHIVCANALRVDWQTVCPPPKGEEEVYIAGNPPFLGSNYQSKEQKVDLANVFTGKIKSFAAFDFVAAWFYKAAAFIRGRRCKAALVATNSVCQGYSVAALWPHVLGSDLEIGFAHKDFKWRNNASSNAAVICSIVGLQPKSTALKRLFSDGVETPSDRINAYLVNGPETYVETERKSLFDLPFMCKGNQPTDGGGLILTQEERDDLLAENPDAAQFLYKFAGSQEIVRGFTRYCLWIEQSQADDAAWIKPIGRRIEAVRQFRLASAKARTRDMALRPFEFDEIRVRPGKSSILVPSVTSERRPYLPVDMVGADVIPSNLNFALYDAPEWCLALIASRLHLVWIGTVCGKLKSDFRYSNTLGWNTFPVPRFTPGQLEQFDASARMILKTRYMHHPKTIAELYDPDKMPDDLREVHRQNDELLESMYIGRPFRNDTERLEKLFKLYAARVEKLKSEPKKGAA